MTTATAHASHDEHTLAHPVPLWLLFAIYGCLMALTVITVGAAYIDFGDFNFAVALFIAVLKAGLVIMFFMHLRWDNPFFGIILISALFFVSLFLGISALDSQQYAPNYNAPIGLVGH